jgi:hypothetical protein
MDSFSFAAASFRIELDHLIGFAFCRESPQSAAIIEHLHDTPLRVERPFHNVYSHLSTPHENPDLHTFAPFYLLPSRARKTRNRLNDPTSSPRNRHFRKSKSALLLS